MRLRAIMMTVAMLAGCSTSSDEEDVLVQVTLSDTRLTGSYDLVDYLIEYGNGIRYDPSILKITGNLTIREDSSYLEDIRLEKDSPPTRGRIVQVEVVRGDRDRGELHLAPDSGETGASAKSEFAFRNDTLVLVTEFSKEQARAENGFRETKYFARIEMP